MAMAIATALGLAMDDGLVNSWLWCHVKLMLINTPVSCGSCGRRCVPDFPHLRVSIHFVLDQRETDSKQMHHRSPPPPPWDESLPRNRLGF